MDKRKKILPAIGVICISTNFLIGELTEPTNSIHFIRGVLAGLGLVFIIFPFIKRKPKTAS